MNWKRVWKWFKAIAIGIYALSMIILVSSLAFITWLTIVDKNSITNSQVVNSLSLMIGLLSLPGIFMQLFSLLDINKKKQFKATSICPNCHHKVDLTMGEI